MLHFLLRSGNCRRLQSKLQEFKSPVFHGSWSISCSPAALRCIFLAPKLWMAGVFAKEICALS